MLIGGEVIRQVEIPYPGHTGNSSTRHANGKHYLTREAIAYRWAVAAAVGRVVPLAGPFSVDWLIAPPDRRARDADNLHKVCGDALTHAGWWVDDSNKVIVSGRWKWTEPIKGGRIMVTAYHALDKEHP